MFLAVLLNRYCGIYHNRPVLRPSDSDHRGIRKSSAAHQRPVDREWGKKRQQKQLVKGEIKLSQNIIYRGCRLSVLVVFFFAPVTCVYKGSKRKCANIVALVCLAKAVIDGINVLITAQNEGEDKAVLSYLKVTHNNYVQPVDSVRDRADSDRGSAGAMSAHNRRTFRTTSGRSRSRRCCRYPGPSGRTSPRSLVSSVRADRFPDRIIYVYVICWRTAGRGSSSNRKRIHDILINDFQQLNGT